MVQALKHDKDIDREYGTGVIVPVYDLTSNFIDNSDILSW